MVVVLMAVAVVEVVVERKGEELYCIVVLALEQ